MPAAAQREAGSRRTCIGCRSVRPPSELVRIRPGPDGSLAVGSGPGRGAWLCRDQVGCLDAAERRRAFERALRAPVAPGATPPLRTPLTGRARMEVSTFRG